MLTLGGGGGASASFGFGPVEQPASKPSPTAIIHVLVSRTARPRPLFAAVDQQNSSAHVNVPVNAKLLLTR